MKLIVGVCMSNLRSETKWAVLLLFQFCSQNKKRPFCVFISICYQFFMRVLGVNCHLYRSPSKMIFLRISELCDP